jgi:hypothetical protein
MPELETQCHELRITPHPEPEGMTAAEIREAIIEAEEDLKLARELDDGISETWFSQKIRILESALNRRNGHGNGLAHDKTDLVEGFIKLCDVQPKPLRWLWHSRIPLGKVTVLDGDPGLGKSLLSIDIAACVSTGRPMPNSATADFPEPAGAVLLSAEDDPEDTIQPRLALVGADLNRIVLLQAVPREDGLSMPTIADLSAITQAVKLVNAKLVVIDPLMAYLPAETNSYRDQDIRRSLAPLAAVAAELNISVLVIRHLNKTSNTNPIYRGGGSIGIIGAARSGLMVAKDPDDDSRCILSVAKSNLAKLPASLSYEILSNADAAVCCVAPSQFIHGTSAGGRTFVS